MVRDVRHDSVYLFGAICPTRGVGAAIIMPGVNTEGMNEHLLEISSQVAPGSHAVLVCDGAGWHQTGRALRVPDNITLLSLPPYAPELNSMENVWAYLRANKLCNLVWNSYKAIVNDCRKAWNFLVDDPDRIRSIGLRDWACVSRYYVGGQKRICRHLDQRNSRVLDSGFAGCECEGCYGLGRLVSSRKEITKFSTDRLTCPNGIWALM